MTDIISLLDMTFKMLLAVLLGGLVGYERESHGRPAGLRTHILVCMGAALFTIVSVQTAGVRFDPGRIAAQIVSGIGFLGAGTIIRQGSIVRGLTTAASLWTVAAIGMAAGIGRDGMWIIAIISTIVVFATLSTINRFEHKLIAARHYRDLLITFAGGRGDFSLVLGVLQEKQVDVTGIEVEETRDQHYTVYRLHLRIPPGIENAVITDTLNQIAMVRGLQWD